MSVYIDEETARQLKSYQTQIVFSFLLILGILMGIIVVKDLYYQTRNGQQTSRQQEANFYRGKLAALLIVIATTYFTFLAYDTYRKQKTRTNLMFLIATELALVATMLRYLNINKGDIENIEDII